MVSSKLTDEEEFLKKQYQILKNLKKEIKRLTLKRKQEQAAAAESGAPNSKQKKVIIQGNKTPSKHSEFSPNSPNYNLTIPPTFDAAANTAKAKELLKSGAIHVAAAKKTTFKRSSNLTRRLLESGGQKKPKLLNTSSESIDDESAPGESQQAKPDKTDTTKAGFKSFDEGKPKFSRRERKSDKKAPRRGNTLYVHGFAVNEQMIKKKFSKFGTIINISVEKEKNSAFVSFDTFEAAEDAIKEMDDALVDNSCRLKVSLARHQPMLNMIKQNTPWDGLAMAERGDKGNMEGETRTIISYGDDDIF